MVETSSRPFYRIPDLHVNERPRERLTALGSQALSNAELLAILLGVGFTAQRPLPDRWSKPPHRRPDPLAG